jgi:dTDP-4-dehydrorhamnose reductase
MKTLLCTGVSGFLGHYVRQNLPADWQLVGTFFQSPVDSTSHHTEKVDLTEEEQVKQLFQSVRPDAVFHLAAQANPNYCEKHPEKTAKVNVKGAQIIAQQCARHQIPCIFTSTDLIFDGKYAPYNEQDQPRPVNEYGRQKRQPELIMQEEYPEVPLARMPLMFGWAGPTAANFFEDFYHKMEQGEPFSLFVDEYRTPVSGPTAVQGLFLLLKKEVTGIYHLGGKQRINRFDFGQAMVEEFSLNKADIRPGKQADIDMPAPRPQDVSLDSSKAFALGYDPHPLRDQLKELKQ